MDRIQEMRRQRFEEKLTLQEIADLHGGISRERVRQLIGNTSELIQVTPAKTRKNWIVYGENKHLSNSKLRSIMGIGQGRLFNYRKSEKIRHDVEGGSIKIGYEAENLASKKLFSIDIKHTLTPTSHSFDILLENGSRVDVKSSNPMNSSKCVSPEYTFKTGKYTKGDYCDFLILVLRDVKEFFVVPTKKAGGIIRFCWPGPDHGKRSKWLEYYNRFDLLKGLSK